MSTTSTTTTTTTKASLLGTEVLVLSTYSWDDVPIITNAAGRQDTNFDFVFGEGTEVDYSCSMTWKNELYIFGGRSKKRQISKLIGCQLTRIGELEFDHYLGACANVADAKLYLCFNDASGDYDKCRVALSPTGIFDEINRSIHFHAFTRIAASEGDHFNCFVGSLFQTTFSHWALLDTRKPKSWRPIATHGRRLVIIPIV